MRALLTIVALTIGAISPARAAPDDIHYACNLSPDEESAETYSSGKGRAEFTLERASLKFSWRVSYEGLTSPFQSVGIYGPDRPGGNAGLVFSLSSDSPKSPLVGSKILNDGELQYLVTGRMYVNLITAKYKDGELRCQVTRLRDNAPNVTQ